MADQKQASVDALRGILDQIAEYQAPALAEGKELGAINFKSGEGLFEQIITLVNEFRALPLDLLPLQTIQQLQQPLQQVAKNLEAISSFSLVGKQNPENERNSLLQAAQQHYDEAFLKVTPHLAYLSLKSAQVQETMRRSKELLDDTEAKVQQGLADFETKKTELDGIVRAARDAAAKIGVAQFATRFDDMSKQHAESAKNWLRTTLILGLLTVGVAVLSLYLLPATGQVSDASMVQRIVTKVVIISLFYFATLWSGRNYKAHRHLAVVNQHRQNSLSTFETFVNAADDSPTKNAVLLEATHCIFSPAVTGYLSVEEENPQSRIVEILKTISPGSKA